MTLLFIVLLIALTLLGVPIFLLIGASGIFAFGTAGIDTSTLMVELYRLASLPALQALPLFTFSGYVLAKSKAPERMLVFAEALLGWIPGGVGIAALITCALFTAFTGASGVTIIALGGLLFPILRQQNYSERFTLGLLTTTGSLGLLFPPSLPIILYGLIAKVSIDKLFLAGLIPGLFLIVLISFYGYLKEYKGSKSVVPFSFSTLKSAARSCAWEIPLPFLIIGGIYGGLFTASEASSIMAFYVLIAEVFIYKDLNLTKDIPKIMVESMVLVSAILMVMGVALGFTNYLIDEQIPMRAFDWLYRFIESKTVFLIFLNIFLLIMNMVEMFSAIIIVVPLIVPVATQYGIDPIHLGIIFLLNLEIGYMTVPLGLNLFLSSHRFNKSLKEVYLATIPFWLLLVGTLMLVTYFPKISLFLVQ